MPVIDVLAWELVANTKGLIAGVGTAQSKLKALSTSAGVAVGAVAALGAAMVVAGARAAKMAADLDQALAKVSTLLPETTAELGDLREQIVALSTRVPQTPVQLTEALYQAISAGARDAAEALFLVEQASKAAVAGQSDTETATKAISVVLNAYQLDISEATRVSDVFFKTIERGIIEFPDLAANIGDVATNASLAGVSIEEVGAALAAMTANGKSAAESTTALNRFLLAAITPSDDLRQVAEGLGVDLSEAGLAANGLVGTLQAMEEAADGSITTLFELNPNIRSAAAAFILAGQGADDFRDNLDAMRRSAGSTEEAFEKMSGTVDGLQQQISNKLNAAFYELGEPILRNLVIPTLEAVNALLPQLGIGANDLAGNIRKINNELTSLERGTKQLQALGEIFSPRVLNELAELIVPGGDIGFEGLRSAFGPEFTEGLSAELAESLERIPDLVQRRGVAIAAYTELGRRIATATSDEAREKLEEQLQQLGRFIATTTRQIKAREAGKTAGNDLAEGVADGINESAGRLRDSLRALIESGARGVQDPEADMGAFADEARIRGFRHELERVSAEFEHAGERALAVQGLLDEWEVEIDDLPPILRTIVRGMTDVGGASAETRDAVRDVVRGVGSAARATAELAEAFGLVGDGAGQVVSQLDLIAQGVTGVLGQLKNPEATFTDFLGPLSLGIGGLAGIVSTVFAGGPSPEEQRRDQIREENTQTLRRLSESIDDLREAILGVPGDVALAFSEALAGIDLSEPFGDIEGLRALRDAVEAGRLTITELENLADRFGVNIEDLIKQLEDPSGGFQDLFGDGRRQLEELAGAVETAAVDLFDTVAGRIDIAQRRIDLFDIDKPIDQIAEFVKVIEESGADLSAAELEQLRAGDDDLIQELVGELETGTGRFEGFTGLGEFSRQELIDLLSRIESIGDRLEASAGGREGFTESFQTFNQITAVQGSAIIAALGTGNFFLRQIAENTSAWLSVFGSNQIQPVRPPSVPGGTTSSGGSSGGGGGMSVVRADEYIGSELDALRSGAGMPEVRF